MSGTIIFGVSDAGIVHGLRLGKDALKRKWMDECEQMLISRASQMLSQEIDPALATIAWQAQSVTAHPDGAGFFLVSVHLKYKAPADGIEADYLIRLDERDGWCWPMKVSWDCSDPCPPTIRVPLPQLTSASFPSGRQHCALSHAQAKGRVARIALQDV